MLSDGAILLYDNTHTNRRTQELLQVESLEPPPYSPDLAPNLGSKHLSGTRFSSESDVKTIVENGSMDMTERSLLKAGADRCHWIECKSYLDSSLKLDVHAHSTPLKWLGSTPHHSCFQPIHLDCSGKAVGEDKIRYVYVPFRNNTRVILGTVPVILYHGQMMRMTPEQVTPSPHHLAIRSNVYQSQIHSSSSIKLGFEPLILWFKIETLPPGQRGFHWRC
ncbi:hypothetical protein AVEN_212950-1 [Araneus ventricosus]|uniref:Uncharacterized protein n=1 Tax=Araneus ventricosus TaxID=182803 RepID=A0A4Y2LRR1_ARAVE|nr:hypothetical protein AVEN_212950-1 [Araneus ventricosus]